MKRKKSGTKKKTKKPKMGTQCLGINENIIPKDDLSNIQPKVWYDGTDYTLSNGVKINLN